MPGKSTLEKGRLRKVWRFLAYCHFRLLGKRRFNRLVLEKIAGRPFLILPQVFHPKLFRSGEFMIANLDPQKIPYGSNVAVNSYWTPCATILHAADCFIASQSRRTWLGVR